MRIVELADERLEVLQDEIFKWDPENDSIQDLASDLDELITLINEINKVLVHGNRRIDNYIDTTELGCAARFKERVNKMANYPIWACDHYGYCLIGEEMEEVKHIDEIEGVKTP